MKPNKNLLILLIVLFAFAQHPTQAKKMRLLYWNVQNGMWDGQTDNYKRFTDFVKSQKPDICVWCEARKLYKAETNQAEKESEAELLVRWKDLAWRYGHQYIYLSACHDGYPQLITSKYPMTKRKLIYGNGSDSIVCHGASWYSFNIHGEDINLVTLHTWPMGYGPGLPKEQRAANANNRGGDLYRRVEMEYICKETILSQPDYDKQLWMMMGDHNAISRLDFAHYKWSENDPRYLCHDYILQNTPYKDVVYEKNNHEFQYSVISGNRIDFVYMTPRLLDMVKNAQTVYTDYTKPVRNPQKVSNFCHPSDHLPILVNFNLKK